MRYLIVLTACFALGGCSFDEAIARAESATKTANMVAERAEIALAGTEKAIAIAQSVVIQAKTVADATGSEQAKAAVETAKNALATAEAILPSVRTAANDAKLAVASAESSVQAAKAAQAAGGSGLEIIIAAIAGFIPALIPVISLAKSLSQARTAIKLTAAHADAMESAETDAEVKTAKDNAIQSQLAAGVHNLIQTVRKG
jgi:hypothetical protein